MTFFSSILIEKLFFPAVDCQKEKQKKNNQVM